MKQTAGLYRNQVYDFKNKFCPLLLKRLQPLIRWEIELKGRFILFVNLIDRTNQQGIDDRVFIYGGINAQREFMTTILKKNLDKYWDHLANSQFLATDVVVARELYAKEYVDKGNLQMNDLKVGNLRDYFKEVDGEIEFDNPWQESEYPILNEYFDIEKDHYLSLPLIQFGQVDGFVHIIFEHKDLKSIEHKSFFKSLLRKLFKKEDVDYKSVFKALIRKFSIEYEGMLLDWELVGDNKEIVTVLDEELDYLSSDDFKNSSENLIFKELNYFQYYRDSQAYLRERLFLNNEVPRYIKSEHRKRAIISILIDSYAHNISAHSLTVLKWWFQQRAENMGLPKELKERIIAEMPVESWSRPLSEYLLQQYPNAYSQNEIEQALLKDQLRMVAALESSKQDNGDFRSVRDQLSPVAGPLAPLFKFLLEKGAFWSGVTRDHQFGGEIRNLYDILWNDFIQNPLYLGTIAYSEGITKLNIHIRMYEWESIDRDTSDEYERTYRIAKTDEGELLNGVFASIDVGGAPSRLNDHEYVKPGTKYTILKSALEDCQVFLPGGVVGKHAFFTLIENEIRNVKHFSDASIQEMQDDGLDLVIALRPKTIAKKFNYPVKALYKVGIWLNHKTDLVPHKEHLVIKREKGLMEDIIMPRTNAARLGGTFQDKICAAMLFNNTFISVEQRETKRDQHYYPWVRAATSQGFEGDGITEIDFEVNSANLKDAEEGLKKYQSENYGYFKKYIHLWKGDFIHNIKSKVDLELENLSRFQMVNLLTLDENSNKLEQQLRSFREVGIIRILVGAPENINKEEAYRIWLRAWLEEDYFRINLHQGDTEIGYLLFDEDQAQYITKAEYLDLPDNVQMDYDEYAREDEKDNLHFQHSTSDENPNVLNIRSHGILKEKFFQNVEKIKHLKDGKIASDLIYELIETIKTRICIFDKRVADRVPKKRRALLKRQLNCEIYGENNADWKKVEPHINKYHFIVIHLSFIEAMKNKAGYRFGEDGVVDFINEKLKGQLAANCILVITTGRGRTEWWRVVHESPYAPFTTFRPVESLIEATEKATLKKDEIELKYNLIKVLFGS